MRPDTVTTIVNALTARGMISRAAAVSQCRTARLPHRRLPGLRRVRHRMGVRDDRSLRLPASEEVPAGHRQVCLTLPRFVDRDRAILPTVPVGGIRARRLGSGRRLAAVC
jgi:hypothetical protein